MEDAGSHNNSSDPDEPQDHKDKNGNGPIKREKTAAEIRKVSELLV